MLLKVLQSRSFNIIRRSLVLKIFPSGSRQQVQARGIYTSPWDSKRLKKSFWEKVRLMKMLLFNLAGLESPFGQWCGGQSHRSMLQIFNTLFFSFISVLLYSYYYAIPTTTPPPTAATAPIWLDDSKYAKKNKYIIDVTTGEAYKIN